MKRLLKKRSVKRYDKIFAIGRIFFPKPEFTNLTFVGWQDGFSEHWREEYKICHNHVRAFPLFSAKGARQVGSMVIADEARWGE